MNDSTAIRYQFNPLLTDTVGFFDYCIPLTNESSPPASDSLKKYYDFSVFNYITPPRTRKLLLETTSIFTPNNLATKHTGPLAINRMDTDWITIVFLTCLIILAWIQSTYSKRFMQIFRAVFQPHFINQLEREGNIFRERITPWPWLYFLYPKFDFHLPAFSGVYRFASQAAEYRLCSNYFWKPIALSTHKIDGN